MTLDQIDRMVRLANPVPDLTTLEPVDASVLVLDQKRRMEMQTSDQVDVKQGRGKPVRGFLVGIVAVAVIVVGALVLFQPKDPDPVATATDVAAQFVQALANYDVDAAAAYLADGANLSDLGGSLEGMRLETRWNEAVGFKVLVGTCEERSIASTGTLVRCTYDFHGLGSDQVGLGPFTGNWYDLTILDGEIVAASGGLNFLPEFSPQIWEPFAAWVAEAHPDDVLVLYTDPSQSMQRMTDEAMALWEQRIGEYVEHVQGSG